LIVENADFGVVPLSATPNIEGDDVFSGAQGVLTFGGWEQPPVRNNSIVVNEIMNLG